MTSGEALSIFKQVVEGPGALLGAMVWSDVQAREADRASLRSALEAAGAPDVVATEVSPQRALGDAIRRWDDKGRSYRWERSERFGRTARLLRSSGDEVRPYVAVCSVDATDAAPGVIVRWTSEAGLDDVEVLRELIDGIAHRQSVVDSTELGAAIVACALDVCHGARLSHRGAPYWVPASDCPTFERVVAAFASAAATHVSFIPVSDTAQARASLGHDVEQDFAARVRALETQLDEYAAALADGTTVRGSTFEARLAEFDELRDNVQLYSGLLAHRQGTLEAKLAAAKERCRAMLFAATK